MFICISTIVFTLYKVFLLVTFHLNNITCPKKVVPLVIFIMSHLGGSTGYGPMSTRMHRLYFDGNEQNYEAWEEKFLGYLLVKKLKKTVIAEPVALASTATDQERTTAAETDAVNNELAYAEMIQFLDPTSHQLVMRDAKDDGRKAIQILRAHYSGMGKSRILSLYTEIMMLSQLPTETTTDFILRAEKIVTALKAAGEQFSDSLLIAIILKGLPEEYTPFTVVVQQKDEQLDFASFKTKLRNYEENNRSRREIQEIQEIQNIYLHYT